MLISSARPNAYVNTYKAPTGEASFHDFAGPTDSFVLSSRDDEGSELSTLKTVSMALLGFGAGGLIGSCIPSGGAGPVICLGMMGAMVGAHLSY